MSVQELNKKRVLEAFDLLFNKRDYETAEGYFSPDYVQHSALVPASRDGLFNLVKACPPELHYESDFILADGDLVMIRGRMTNFGGPKAWIAADLLRVKDGVFIEHWDVLQQEATRAESKSGLPMFGNAFGTS